MGKVEEAEEISIEDFDTKIVQDLLLPDVVARQIETIVLRRHGETLIPTFHAVETISDPRPHLDVLCLHQGRALILAHQRGGEGTHLANLLHGNER